MKIVTMDPSICVGCKNCEYACSFVQKNDFVAKDANIKVNWYPEDRLCIPVTCLHCQEPWCLEVCPANAISRNEASQAVEIDQERCAGCKMCMLACPFGNIHYDKEKKVSGKCDLCGGDPKCVKFCISGALQFEEEEDAFYSKRLMFDNKIKKIFGKGNRKNDSRD